MDKLIRIIGPAPSEMSDGELEAKLRKERTRVTNVLENFLSAPQKKKAPKARAPAQAKIAREVLQACEKLGITIEEFLETKRELEEEEKTKNGD